MGILADETGKRSLARVLLIVSLVITFVLVILDSILIGDVPVLDVPVPAYALLGTIFTGLLAWTAGPRIAQYVGPQMGAIASGLAKSVKRDRTAGVDDSRKDDERDA